MALISGVSYYPTGLFSKNPNWLLKVALLTEVYCINDDNDL